jgi:hypothetical protein
MWKGWVEGREEKKKEKFSQRRRLNTLARCGLADRYPNTTKRVLGRDCCIFVKSDRVRYELSSFFFFLFRTWKKRRKKRTYASQHQNSSNSGDDSDGDSDGNGDGEGAWAVAIAT